MPFPHPLRWLKSTYGGHPLRVFTVALKTIFLGHLFTSYGYTIIPVWGPSMMPTFEVLGDHLLVSKHHRRGRDIRVGDIIQFDMVHEPGPGAVKRVLGLPGDYVLMNSPRAKYQDMIQVPQGHCWVIGDNLDYSRDSRHWGPLPMALIRGKIIGKVFPWSERRWVVNDLEK